MGRKRKLLGEILLDAGLVSGEALKKTLFEKLSTEKKLGELLVEKGILKEEEIVVALSKQLGFPTINLRETRTEPALLELVPERLARRPLMIPVAVRGRELSLAMVDPTNMEAAEDAAFASGCEIRPCVATRTDLLAAIDRCYSIEASVEEIVRNISTTTRV